MAISKVVFALGILVMTVSVSSAKALPSDVWTPPSKLSLWYDHPATNTLTETLPVGDALTCCRIEGGVDIDDTQFQALSQASHGDTSTGYPVYLPENQETQGIHIAMPDHAVYTNYHRDLDLTQAIAHVTYTVAGTHYTRSYFWSKADRALVIQLTADKRLSYTGSITLTSPRNDTVTATTDTLTSSGKWSANEGYASEVRIQHDEGSLVAHGSEIDFTKCNSLTIIGISDESVGTPSPVLISGRIADASLKSFDGLLKTHLQEYLTNNDPASLVLRGTPPDRLAMPVDKRLDLADDGSDPALQGLLIQYLQYQRVISGNDLLQVPLPDAPVGDALSNATCNILASRSTLPNLLVTRRNVPELDSKLFQGIKKSLIHYNDGDIYLLPNLPSGWKSGYASGLSAGNDFTVDITWIEGRLAVVMIHSLTGKEGTVHYGKISADVQIKAGKALHLGSILEPEL